jgi:hypothetical protein
MHFEVKVVTGVILDRKGKPNGRRSPFRRPPAGAHGTEKRAGAKFPDIIGKADAITQAEASEKVIVGEGYLFRTDELIFINYLYGGGDRYKKIGLSGYTQLYVLVGLMMKVQPEADPPEAAIGFGVGFQVRSVVKKIEIGEKDLYGELLIAPAWLPEAVSSDGIQRVDENFAGVGVAPGVIVVNQHTQAVIGVEVEPEGEGIPGSDLENIGLITGQEFYPEGLRTAVDPELDTPVDGGNRILPDHGLRGNGRKDIDLFLRTVQ